MKKLLISAAALGLLATSTLAQLPPPPPPPSGPPQTPLRSISISGEAHEEIAPDQAVLSLSLVSKDKDLHVAKEANDKMVEKLVAITKKFEISKEKINTSRVSINPEYNYVANQEPQFRDYVVNRSFRVTMDNLDVPEKLLAAVVEANIDQVNGLEYTLADPDKQAMALRVKAFADAKAKADALAQAAGAKLGPAITISTNEAPMPFRPMPMMKAMGAGAMQSVAPELPGTVELRETVSVTFELE